MRNLLSNSIKACVLVLSVLFSGQAFAQVVQQSHLTCTPAQSHCTSKDLSVVDIFVDLPPCTPCTGGSVTAPLRMTIHNGTKSERTAFALWGTLSSGSINGISGNIFICVGAITVKQGDQTFLVGNITFNCNQSLTLNNILMAWTDASGTTADRCTVFSQATDCADIEPKCGQVPSIAIRQPLTFSATDVDACSGSSDGSLIVTPIGGLAPYSVTVGSVTLSVQNGSSGTFTGLSAGVKSVRVTDAQPCTSTGSATVDAKFCCSSPTQGTNPSNFSVCDGGSATFTATATGGSPAPTVQWQEKVGAGSFTNITNGGFYSGATTGTLVISNVTGKNGNQYRAVFTSAGCAPFTTPAGTLTVYPLPPTPNAAAQPITDPCTTSTYCVLVNNVVANATYTIRDATGATFGNTVTITPGTAIHTTSTANITFCGIPAGTGFQVNVVSDNNCAPTNAPLPCGNTITKKASTTTTIELNDDQTSVKAYPNPFSDRVKFLVTSAVAGRGSLEVYNMMGQKVKTVYQGFINSGTQTFELSLPRQQIANLVYVLRVGDKKMSGKLLQINR